MERASTALAESGLQLSIHRKDGDKGFIAFAIVDPAFPRPASPEAVTSTYYGTGCCC